MIKYESTVEEVLALVGDLVALWESPVISGLPRSERNAAIEGVRTRLIDAYRAYEVAHDEASTSLREGQDRRINSGQQLYQLIMLHLSESGIGDTLDSLAEELPNYARKSIKTYLFHMRREGVVSSKASFGDHPMRWWRTPLDKGVLNAKPKHDEDYRSTSRGRVGAGTDGSAREG